MPLYQPTPDNPLGRTPPREPILGRADPKVEAKVTVEEPMQDPNAAERILRRELESINCDLEVAAKTIEDQQKHTRGWIKRFDAATKAANQIEEALHNLKLAKHQPADEAIEEKAEAIEEKAEAPKDEAEQFRAAVNRPDPQPDNLERAKQAILLGIKAEVEHHAADTRRLDALTQSYALLARL